MQCDAAFVLSGTCVCLCGKYVFRGEIQRETMSSVAIRGRRAETVNARAVEVELFARTILCAMCERASGGLCVFEFVCEE